MRRRDQRRSGSADAPRSSPDAPESNAETVFSRWPLVGRALELRELSGALDHVRRGRGATFLLSGEAGIGKTRLAEEIANRARAGEMLVLWGRCSDASGAPAFWPWAQILRAYVDAVPSERSASVGSDRESGVRRIAPDLFAPASDDENEAAGRCASDTERLALFDSFTRYLKQAAARRPLVVIVDDLQVADSESLLLLRFIAREVRDVPILLIATLRDHERPRSPTFPAVMEAIARDSRALPLRGLDDAEGMLLYRRSLGTTPCDLRPAELRAKTGGNPFVIAELGSWLSRSGAAAPSVSQPAPRGSVAPRLAAFLEYRVSRLPAACADLLSVAAVIGDRFDAALLEKVTRIDGADLAARIGQCVIEGIVEEVARAPGARVYRFRHSLLRDAVHARIHPERRSILHRRVGEALETLRPSEVERNLSVLAYHFLEAVPAGEASRAFDYALQAGRNALARCAYEEAAVLLERAATELPQDGEADAKRQCELLLALGDAHWGAGNVETADQVFRYTARKARGIASDELLARAAFGLGRVADGHRGRHPKRPSSIDGEKLDCLREAVERLGEREPVLRARLYAALAWQLYWLDALEERTAASRQAVDLARGAADPSALAEALNAHCFSLSSSECFEERVAATEEMVTLAARLDDPAIAPEAHAWRVLNLLEEGDIYAVDREIDCHARLAAKLQHPRYRWRTLVWQGMRATVAGHFERAERLAAEAYCAGEPQNAFDVFRLQTLQLRRERGQLEEVAVAMGRLLERRPDRGDRYPGVHCGLAQIYSELGWEAEARREFEYFAGAGFANLEGGLNWLAGLACLADACAFLGDRERAPALYERLSPYAGRCAVIHDAVACIGPVDRFLGKLAVVLGRWDAASAHFDRALDSASVRLGSPPFVARAQVDYAAALLARGSDVDRKVVRSLLEAGRSQARELGMAIVGNRAGDLLGRLEAVEDGSAPAPAPAGSQRRGRNVIRREGEYWLVAYAGHDPTRLRDGKGVRYLAQLLHYPHRSFAALDLVEIVGAGASSGRTQGDAGPILDGAARDAYRRRLADLREELEQAEADSDAGRCDKLRHEKGWLEEQLSAAVGLAGRARVAGSPRDLARLRVTKRLKAVIAKIAGIDAPLGQHLRRFVRTGHVCAYEPPPDADEPWST